MAPRRDLQDLLVEILESDSVYFQPPVNVQIKYPCIIYKRDNIVAKWADDKPYNLAKRYTVTVIDRNPDSDIPDKLAALRHCRFDRFYIADNLNHNVFTLFF